MIEQAKANDALLLIRCMVGQETYCMDMSWVRSIQRSDRLQRNPSRDASLGWLASKQGTVPVFSLATQLRRAIPVDHQSGQIIVMDSVPKAWALMASRVSRVVWVENRNLFPLPPVAQHPAAPLFKGVVKLDGELTLYLSPEHLYPGAAPVLETPSSDELFPYLRRPHHSSEVRRSYGRVLLFSTTDPRPSVRLLTFGLSVAQVLEILDPLPILPVPIASPFMLGLVDWRDRPVPVIDLNLRLGLGPSRLEGSRLLIARASSEGELIGFPVRPQVRVQTLPMAHEPVSRHLFGQWSLTRGVFELSSETLVVPDLDSLLLAPRVAAGPTDGLGLPSVPATS